MANLGLALAGGQIAGGLTEAMRYAEQERLKRQYMGLQEREQATAERSLGLREQYQGAQIKQWQESMDLGKEQQAMEKERFELEKKRNQITDQAIQLNAAVNFWKMGMPEQIEQLYKMDTGSLREVKDQSGNTKELRYTIGGQQQTIPGDMINKMLKIEEMEDFNVPGIGKVKVTNEQKFQGMLEIMKNNTEITKAKMYANAQGNGATPDILNQMAKHQDMVDQHFDRMERSINAGYQAMNSGLIPAKADDIKAYQTKLTKIRIARNKAHQDPMLFANPSLLNQKYNEETIFNVPGYDADRETINRPAPTGEGLESPSQGNGGNTVSRKLKSPTGHTFEEIRTR